MNGAPYSNICKTQQAGKHVHGRAGKARQGITKCENRGQPQGGNSASRGRRIVDINLLTFHPAQQGQTGLLRRGWEGHHRERNSNDDQRTPGGQTWMQFSIDIPNAKKTIIKRAQKGRCATICSSNLAGRACCGTAD